jgi:hypothetical protein
MTTFGRRLALVAAIALVLRVVVAFVAGFHAEGTLSDSLNYHLLGAGLADGAGYVRAFDRVISNVRVPTAEFPPLLPMVLAAFDRLGIDRVRGQEAALAALGTSTMVLVGLIGREIAGARTGLVAAALAAVYPMLVLPDATLQSEGLYGALVAATLLAALVARRSERHIVPWLVVGAGIGLAALTRSEAVLLLPFVVLPITRAWRPLALTALAAIAVLAPWFVRNALTLDKPVLLSNNSGTLLAGANCAESYHGDGAGLWSFGCTLKVPIRTRNETRRTELLTDAGVDYARSHVSDLPGVAATRVLRTFGVWRPRQQLHEEAREGRDHTLLVAGYVLYLALAVASVAGVVIGRRRHLRIGPLVGAIGLVVVTSAATYGNERFRIAAEPSLLVLAAVALAGIMPGGMPRQEEVNP